jgi:hypothetical protein
MRRLSGLITGVTMLAVLAGGCGSTGGLNGGNDALVLQFIQWDNTGITQADSVGESNADVDVVQDLCSSGTGGVPSAEPFTQTLINAILQNNEGSDIQLQHYSTEIGDPRLSQSNILNGTLTTNLPGGRCPSGTRQCFTDADCGLGGGLATCQHSETTVSGIVLFDFLGKEFIYTVSLAHPEVLGQATPLKVTFSGSDPNRSFQIFANYLVTFGDYNNCPSSGGTGGS